MGIAIVLYRNEIRIMPLPLFEIIHQAAYKFKIASQAGGRSVNTLINQTQHFLLHQ